MTEQKKTYLINIRKITVSEKGLSHPGHFKGEVLSLDKLTRSCDHEDVTIHFMEQT